MRLVVCSVIATGCSFVYNPDHIVATTDAHTVDVEVVADVDPTMLKLTDAYPTEVFEGAGTGGARGALVVIYGKQIAPDAVVTITPENAVKILSTTVASDHNFLALSLEVDDDAMDNDGQLVPLSIAIAQSSGAYHDVLDAVVSVHHLDALTAVPTALKDRYSHVAITGDWTLPTGSHAAVRAVGAIEITGKVIADAVGPTPGPGGCAGGGIGADGAAENSEHRACTGRGHAVANGVLNGGGGGGAGFVVRGEAGASSGGDGGDPFGTAQIPSFAASVPSGGGGGAKNTGAGGGAGGGGGGAVEFTAGGDLSIPMGISAHGGKGTDVLNGGGGGGGDGGVILVRAGGNITLGALDVSRGEGGIKTPGLGNGVAGGAGSVGRTRVDATAMVAADYHGPMFLSPPQVSTSQGASVTIRGDLGDQTLVGQVYDRDDSAVSLGSFSPQIGGNAQASSSFQLRAGYNRVCVGVAGGNAFTLPESTNCAELAYLP